MIWAAVAAAILGELWPVIVVAVAFGLLARWWWRWDNRLEARAAAARAELAETAARADVEHQQVMRDDPRGTYGIGWESYCRYRDAVRRLTQ